MPSPSSHISDSIAKMNGMEALFRPPHRFSFNGQERDDEVSGEGNSLSFKYRVVDTRLGRFFSVDPLFRKYSYNSTYAFAENRVVDGREFEGLEVVLINKDEEEIYKAATSNDDQSAVHIYAHGTPSQLDVTGKGKWSDKVEDFKIILEKSTVYQTSSSTEEIVVILHSCRVGRSYYDENGTYTPSYAEKLSKNFPEYVFIAPDERVGFTKDGIEIGPVKIENPKNLRADYIGNKPEFSNRYGNWNVFKNGDLLGSYYGGNYNGQKQPTLIERLFYFKENTQQRSDFVQLIPANESSTEKK